MQQGASFWADIKHLEERLAQDPKSYLFARLADVYLKVNLIDDALHTARQGGCAVSLLHCRSARFGAGLPRQGIDR